MASFPFVMSVLKPHGTRSSLFCAGKRNQSHFCNSPTPGDVELKNMQLKPEAFNALKLPLKVKASFLGSVKLKLRRADYRLGQEPVLVYLDRIFILAELATQVKGCTEDAVQEAKKSGVTGNGNEAVGIAENMQLKPEAFNALKLPVKVKAGFLGSMRLKAGSGTGVSLSGPWIGVILYLDCAIKNDLGQSGLDLLPSESCQVFEFGTNSGKSAGSLIDEHAYIPQPVAGNAKYLEAAAR
ncbi:hypothetical protein NE237_027023 [Protea cynaroides]|uniref:Uncharacterized protein n=1 Tax=Protea cynaroides TaxID=273540 RepID=A0A9Q0JSL4_9MAGN|nr:hypothetical protein NE237_027023 [Protea cynaroides]